MRSVNKLFRISTRRLAKHVHNQRGTAVVEVSLLAPWILFLFVGMFDMGMYTYSMIGVENAARVAAEYTSSSWSYANDSAGACIRALAELAMLPNVQSGTVCDSTKGVNVTATRTAASSVDGQQSTTVTVTYTGGHLIPIPGLLMGQLNLTRSIEMRVKP